MRFISELFTSDTDKATFLRGVAVMKISDRSIGDVESEFLSNVNAVLRASERLVSIAKEYVGNHTQAESIESVVFNNKEQVVSFILNAGRLAYTDGEFAPGEQNVLTAIAKLNHINEEELELLLAEIKKEYEFYVEREAVLKKILEG